MDNKAAADYYKWVRSVLNKPGNMLKLALFRCKKNFIIVALFKNGSYVFNKKVNVNVEKWRRSV